MSRNIGGTLDVDALARFHFWALPADQQAQAIRRMHVAGNGERTIAHATGLSVEAIRRVLALEAA
jgi:hypothetical protein